MANSEPGIPFLVTYRLYHATEKNINGLVAEASGWMNLVMIGMGVVGMEVLFGCAYIWHLVESARRIGK